MRYGDIRGEGIDAVNMTPEASLQEYGRMILKVGALYRAVFGNRYVMSFLRGTPGIESWSLLGKAYYHVNEEQNGRPRYDLVILDGPATGHALDMLRTPHALREMVPPGLMRREADGAWELFTDPERTAFALVSIPEDMPVNETVELYQTFNDELGLPVGGVILNRCYPDLFDAAEEAWLEQVEPASGSISSSLLESGRRRVAREVMQVEAERRLAEDIGVPLFRLPEIHSAAFGVGEIETLSEALGAQGMRASERVL